MLGHEDLVVFAEGVGRLEEFIVKPHTRLCDIEHELMVDFRHQCLSGPNPHGWEAFCLSLVEAVSASCNGVEIRRNLEGLRENKDPGTFDFKFWVLADKRACCVIKQRHIVGRVTLCACFVGDNDPVRRALSSKGECCLDAWLLKAREDVVAKVCFKLGIQVLLSIFAVSKRVEAAAVVSVLVEDDHCRLVLLANFEHA